MITNNQNIDYKKWATRITILLFSALLFSFGIKVFISSAKTYSAGVGSIPQLITYVTKINQRWFSLLYLGFNMPLIIIFWFLLRKRFIVLTFIWLLMQVMWGQVLEVVPYVRDANPFQITDGIDGIQKAGWPVVIQSLAGGLFIGLGVGLAWRHGASSGGSDIIVCWYTNKKNKSIGAVAFVFAMAFTTFSIGMELIITKGESNGENILQKTLGVRTIGTIIYIMLNTYFINKLYPRFKKVKVTISSKLINEILVRLKEINYPRGYVTFAGISGFTNKETKNIQTVMLFLEFKRFVRIVKAVDPQAWISSSLVHEVVGNFKVEDVD